MGGLIDQCTHNQTCKETNKHVHKQLDNKGNDGETETWKDKQTSEKNMKWRTDKRARKWMDKLTDGNDTIPQVLASLLH